MHQGNHRDHEGAKKLFDLVDDIKIAMMTTADTDGTLVSRPMWSQSVDASGDLWFFTRLSSPKTEEIARETQVNLAFSHPGKQDYVSIAGKAEVVRVKDKWSESMRTWFPKGTDDPDIALIRVHPEKGEYWDAPSATMVHAYGYVKAVVTGQSPQGGDAKKVDLA